MKLADENYLKGDEESAFVLYMKFFTLFTSTLSKKEYASYKAEISDGIGGNHIVLPAMDRLEKLRESLIVRYQQKHNHQGNSLSKQKISDSTEMDIFKLSSIDSDELFKKLKEKATLLIDVRKKEEFEASSIVYAFCLNIPGDQIQNG